MNLLPRNWEWYYAYSSRVGRKLCLLISVRTLPLLRCRHKNPLIHMPCDLHRKTPRRGREAAAPSFIKEIQEEQGGQEVPHDGDTIIPKDA
jgi:hypothetical protein